MDKLKVAHLHTVDQSGGGAKIVRNLHTGLNKDESYDSQLFVGEKKTDIDGITELPSIYLEEEFNKFVEHVLSLEGLAAPSSFRYPKIIKDYNPDILHIHNIHGNYFNFVNLKRLVDDITIVWTLHDMWPLTGRCVHPYDCQKYKQACHDCPYLDTTQRIAFDSTSQLHKIKKKIFSDCSPVIITPSEWITRKVNESYLDPNIIRCIPHGINTKLFSPMNLEKSRQRFNLSLSSIVILFIANGLSNPVKGMKHLLTALDKIEGENVSLLAVGGNKLPKNKLSKEFDVYSPGYITNNELPAAYSAADVTVVPSLYESFGLVATESMSCGTPVVAYNTSGLREQITESTGWLAKFRDTDSLAEKIREAIQDKEKCRIKGKRARKRTINNYGQRRFLKEHKEMYRQLTTKKHNKQTTS